MKTVILILVLASFFKLSYGQEKVIPLYEGMIPNSKIAPADYVEHIDSSGLTRNLSNPSITAYLPEKGTATGTAVIICPGVVIWFCQLRRIPQLQQKPLIR